MRSLTLLSLIAVSTLALVACGGGGGDDNTGDDAPDANTQPDANNATDQALGLPCTATECPAEASICAELDQTADGGFCTLSCGTTVIVSDPQNPPDPPAGGDAMCAAQYHYGSGTPACVLYQNDDATQMATWYCGVLCGTAGQQNFGDCPAETGFTCQMNLCDD